MIVVTSGQQMVWTLSSLWEQTTNNKMGKPLKQNLRRRRQWMRIHGPTVNESYWPIEMKIFIGIFQQNFYLNSNLDWTGNEFEYKNYHTVSSWVFNNFSHSEFIHFFSLFYLFSKGKDISETMWSWTRISWARISLTGQAMPTSNVNTQTVGIFGERRSRSTVGSDSNERKFQQHLFPFSKDVVESFSSFSLVFPPTLSTECQNRVDGSWWMEWAV